MLRTCRRGLGAVPFRIAALLLEWGARGEVSVRHRSFVAVAGLALGALGNGCGSSPGPATPAPPVRSSVVITSVAPATGSTLVVPAQYPYFELGGVVLPQGSGLLSVGLTATSDRAVPFAKLNVYLLADGSASDYCGQNLPDSPAWTSLPAGFTASVTVTGFQIFRLPCSVTGVRAFFHTRNSGQEAPPSAAETIAEATLPIGLELRQ